MEYARSAPRRGLASVRLDQSAAAIQEQSHRAQHASAAVSGQISGRCISRTASDWAAPQLRGFHSSKISAWPVDDPSRTSAPAPEQERPHKSAGYLGSGRARCRRMADSMRQTFRRGSDICQACPRSSNFPTAELLTGKRPAIHRYVPGLILSFSGVLTVLAVLTGFSARLDPGISLGRMSGVVAHRLVAARQHGAHQEGATDAHRHISTWVPAGTWQQCLAVGEWAATTEPNDATILALPPRMDDTSQCGEERKAPFSSARQLILVPS